MDDEERFDPIEDSHRVMQEHLPERGCCGNCGQRYPCQRRLDARSHLIREGRLVLTGASLGTRP